MNLETKNKTIPLHVKFSKELGNPLFIPFQKDATDTSHRIIKGYASTDALDREGQIVTKEAVSSALAEYLNVNPTLRADHRPPPIGKTIVAKSDDKGLLIHARINKGYQAAEDAWSAILQDAYNAFSIGGLVKEARREFDKELNHSVTKITKLMISEISVTDAPANPDCSFQVLHKSIEFQIAKDMGIEVEKMNDATIIKQEPTGEPTEEPEAPTIEDRVAKIEQVLAQIVEKLQGEGEPTEPVEASVEAKAALVADLANAIEPIIAKSLGITNATVPIQKAVQATQPIVPPDADPKQEKESGDYSLHEMIMGSLGKPVDEEES